MWGMGFSSEPCETCLEVASTYDVAFRPTTRSPGPYDPRLSSNGCCSLQTLGVGYEQSLKNDGRYRARLTRIKQVISAQQFKGQTSHRPAIRSIIPFVSKDDFRTPVLPGLDVVGKVVIDVASISEIRNLHLDLAIGERAISTSQTDGHVPMNGIPSARCRGRKGQEGEAL